MPPQVAAIRFMRVRPMPPMAFPFADMQPQRFLFDPSLMQFPPTDATETLNGN